jgi:organic radical activating enzyme
MKIKIKGIYPERSEDAPFIGALICSDNCNFNCVDCCNDDLKFLPSEYVNDYKIIQKVKSNPFNKGIILGGLEWTLQSKEMFRLIELALDNQLEVILYTGLDLAVLINKFPELLNYNIYIKTGKYIEELKTNNNIQYGVKLASLNQKINQIKNKYILYEGEI